MCSCWPGWRPCSARCGRASPRGRRWIWRSASDESPFRMRIAFDGRNASRGLGQSTFIVALATELVASGKVELVWLGDPGTAPRGVAGVVRVDRLPYPALDGALGRALARRLGVELIHFTGNTGWGRHGP